MGKKPHVVSVLELIDSCEELQEALTHPDSFFADAADAARAHRQAGAPIDGESVSHRAWHECRRLRADVQWISHALDDESLLC